MDCFKWGGAFFSINELYFDRYSECKTSEEMFIAQDEVKLMVAEMKEQNRNRQIDLPPSSSEEEDDDDE